jgi:hypothetical protein
MSNLDPQANDLREDALVEQLIPDPAQEGPGVLVFTGFLGRSTREGYWRLYLSPSLDRYLEVAASDIIHSQSLANEQNPVGGSALWLKSDATLALQTRTNPQQVQAQFLVGQINKTRPIGAQDVVAGQTLENVQAVVLPQVNSIFGLFACPTSTCEPSPIPPPRADNPFPLPAPTITC